jgi:septum formation protein
VDEEAFTERNPEKRALKLAQLKAKDVASRVKNAVVIACDLIVVFKGKIYEKPKSKKQAYEMLKTFSGKRVDIVAGLAVIDSESGKMFSKLKRCRVQFKKLSNKEIRDYMKRYPVLSFSGAFDGNAVLMFAKHIDGDALFYTSIPLSELSSILEKLKVI